MIVAIGSGTGSPASQKGIVKIRGEGENVEPIYQIG